MFAKQFYWYKLSWAFQLSLCFLLGTYWLAGFRLPDGGGESYHFGGKPKLRSRPPVMVLTLAASQSFPLVPYVTSDDAHVGVSRLDPTPWLQKSYLQLPPRCLCWSSKGASQTKLVQDWAPQMPPNRPSPLTSLGGWHLIIQAKELEVSFAPVWCFSFRALLSKGSLSLTDSHHLPVRPCFKLPASATWITATASDGILYTLLSDVTWCCSAPMTRLPPNALPSP